MADGKVVGVMVFKLPDYHFLTPPDHLGL